MGSKFKVTGGGNDGKNSLNYR